MDNHLDAVVFTGGIGENVSLVREIILSKLCLMGFKIDIKKNLLIKNGKSGFITLRSTIPVLVVPTNEELLIAQETMKIVSLI